MTSADGFFKKTFHSAESSSLFTRNDSTESGVKSAVSTDYVACSGSSNSELTVSEVNESGWEFSDSAKPVSRSGST